MVSYCRDLSALEPINKIYRLQMDIISLLYFAPLYCACTTNSAPSFLLPPAPDQLLYSLHPQQTRRRKEIDSTGIIPDVKFIQKGIKRVRPDTTCDIIRRNQLSDEQLQRRCRGDRSIGCCSRLFKIIKRIAKLIQEERRCTQR